MEFLRAHADIIMAVNGFIFTTPLVLTVIEQFRSRASTVPLSTSALTVLGLSINASVFAALGLWLVVVAALLNAGVWIVLGLQRWRYGAPV